MRMAFAALLFASCALPWGSDDGPPPAALRCEYVATPLGVDSPRPRLSWQVVDPERGARQSAWQILVATAPERLEPGSADVWDSGRVFGDDSVHVEWQGPALASSTRYWWTVRTWNGAGRASAFAPPTWFETGLLAQSDWSSAMWVGTGLEAPVRDEDFYRVRPAPLLRKSFHLDGAPRRARLYVVGLGWHEARLNGERIGDHRLDPAWTRFDELVPYVVHDVTDLLQDGENVLGVMLGRGWYDPLPLLLWGRLNLREVLAIGTPKLLCRLEVVQADGSTLQVVSDRSWRTAPGPILRDNVYLGEHHDARQAQDGWDRAEFDDRAWRRAEVEPAPGGELRWLPVPPVRAGAELSPVAITTPRPDVHVVDFGQNFAGVVRLAVDAEPGTEVGLRYGEELLADGTVDVTSTTAAQIHGAGKGGPGAPDTAAQEDRFVCRGEGREVFEPRFTFHGFRYVEITGLPAAPAAADVTGIAWHTDLVRVSAFECSSELCNRIWRAVDWTLRSNAFSVLSDCPARERFGYGGDMVASASAYQANFDMATMHRKAVEDFARDARPDGGLPECAPDVGVNESGLTSDTGPLGWMLAHPHLLHRCWTEYGDRRLVEEQYPTLQRLVAFCRSKLPEHLSIACFGDHGNVGFNPSPLMATAAWHRMVTIQGELATVLGRADDARECRELAAAIAAACAKWMNHDTGEVFVRTQSGQATALHHGLVPPELREKAFGVLLDEIQQKQGRLSTGMFATEHMFDVLRDRGRDDLAYAMITSRQYPGYGHMLDQGATTLWEHWSRIDGWSRNHPMYSAVGAWFQRSLLGIRQAAGSVAWREILVAPAVVGDVTWARGHLDTVRGRIVSSWRRSGGRLVLDVEIPANTRATVVVPLLGRRDPTITENGVVLVANGAILPADVEAGIEVASIGPSGCEVRVGGGVYRFALE